jgi:hypothetical protein
MNDPKEFTYQPLVTVSPGGPGAADLATIQEEVQRYGDRRQNVRVGCFVRDAAAQPNLFGPAIEETRGFANPTMWAHYGDRHRGVCLAFRRSELELTLSQAFGAACRMADVAYFIPRFDGDFESLPYQIDLHNTTYDEHFERHLANNVFRKSPHWSYEREWRCAVVDWPAAIDAAVDIRSSIAGLVLGCAFDVQNMAVVKAIASAYRLAGSVGMIGGTDTLHVGGIPSDW